MLRSGRTPAVRLLTAAAHARELQYPLSPVRLSSPPGGRGTQLYYKLLKPIFGMTDARDY